MAKWIYCDDIDIRGDLKQIMRLTGKLKEMIVGQ